MRGRPASDAVRDRGDRYSGADAGRGVGGSSRAVRSTQADARRRADAEAEAAEFEREYYTQDEQGMGSSAGSEVFLGSAAKFKEREAEMRKRREREAAGLPGAGKARGMSARKSALMADQRAWEENRLHTSGATRQGERSRRSC